MARSFASASSQYLTNGNAVLTATPLTLAAWFKATDLTNQQVLISLNDNLTSGFTGAYDLRINGGSSGSVRAIVYDGATPGIADTTVTASSGAWTHAAAVFASNSAQAAYVNGGNGVTNGATSNPTGIVRTDVGTRATLAGLFANCTIAEAAVWNVALTVAEIAALAAGVSPRRLRPGNLKAHWPLFGLTAPEPDLAGGGFNLTLSGGPTQANHAPVTLLTPPWRGEVEPAVVAGSVRPRPPLVALPPFSPSWFD